MERLFIYGTLGPGGPNEHIMTDIGGDWMPASVKGKLFEEGWGADMGYPGIVPGGDQVVRGHVFNSDNLKKNWASLDEFEGDEYERVTIQAELEDGQIVDAYVYAIRQPI